MLIIFGCLLNVLGGLEEGNHDGSKNQQCRSAVVRDIKCLKLVVHLTGNKCKHKSIDTSGSKYQTVVHAKIFQTVKVFGDGWKQCQIRTVVGTDKRRNDCHCRDGSEEVFRTCS